LNELNGTEVATLLDGLITMGNVDDGFELVTFVGQQT